MFHVHPSPDPIDATALAAKHGQPSRRWVPGGACVALWLVLALVCLLEAPGRAAESQPSSAQDADLPLPSWFEIPETAEGNLPAPSDLAQDAFMLGGPLLPPAPDMLTGGQEGHQLTEDSVNRLSERSPLSPRDLALFLHGSILSQASDTGPEAKPSSVLTLREVPREMLAQTHLAAAEEYLLDPQGLVPEVPRQDLERLLEFHADDARIRMYILMIDRDQKVPQQFNAAQVANGALTKREACLVYYPLGEPWRARFLMSPPVHHAAPVPVLTELANDCMEDALQASDPAQQLQRFAVRLSTRLFWLEKHLPIIPTPVPVASRALHEVAPEAPMDVPKPAQTTWPTKLLWVIAITSLLAVLILSGLLIAQRRQRREPQQSWMLPERESPPHLGGAFSGGAGAMMSYGRREPTWERLLRPVKAP